MDKLNKILLPALAKKGLGKATKSAMVCFYAEKWGNGRLRAISFSEGILKLSVNSSAAASEMDMQKDELINYLKNNCPRNFVKKIVWKIVN